MFMHTQVHIPKTGNKYNPKHQRTYMLFTTMKEPGINAKYVLYA